MQICPSYRDESAPKWYAQWAAILGTSIPVLAVAFSSLASVARAEDVNSPQKSKTLERLAEQSFTNYTKIITWVAEYEIADVYPVNDELLLRMKVDQKPSGDGPWMRQDAGTVSFTFDSPAENIYTSIEMTDCRLIRDADDNPINVVLPLTSPQRSIITPTHFYSFVPTDNWPSFKEVPALEGVFGRVAFREPLEKVDEQNRSTIVDPRDLFAYSRFFWEELRAISTQLQTEGKFKDIWDKAVSVGSFGSPPNERHVVKIRLARTPDSDDVRIVRFTMHPKYDFNFTDVTISDSHGKVFQTMSWEYRDFSGIFIPIKISRKNFRQDDGSLSMMRLLQLKSSTLNEPVKPSTFTVSQLGLKKGERVMDRVEEICYLYENGKLVNPVRFDEPAETENGDLRASEGISISSWILAGNVVFIAVLLFLLLRRRMSHV